MTAPVLSISRRLRETPFTKRVTQAGVKGLHRLQSHVAADSF